ncbi:hypothetical protein CB1_000377006 [Camelus ferus]|nr:hypothetical protein CB1_000377006 [Camelus ferus]
MPRLLPKASVDLSENQLFVRTPAGRTRTRRESRGGFVNPPGQHRDPDGPGDVSVSSGPTRSYKECLQRGEAGTSSFPRDAGDERGGTPGADVCSSDCPAAGALLAWAFPGSGCVRAARVREAHVERACTLRKGSQVILCLVLLRKPGPG